ncbi:SUKH-4 family immunity protein [Catellatospora coxensis]|nr:SUKH-4 family immunity protein [Catellatospora coxensis]
MYEATLPVPPTFDELSSWAGPQRVVRATAAGLASWRLPAEQVDALVSSGVPVLDSIVEDVVLRREARWYRLAQTSPTTSDWFFTAEPDSGRVFQRYDGNDGARLVNSSINHWLCSLHWLGSLLATSHAIAHWDESGELEEAAQGEMEQLRDRIGRLDPPAVAGGRHDRLFWPAVLDRWLY